MLLGQSMNRELVLCEQNNYDRFLITVISFILFYNSQTAVLSHSSCSFRTFITFPDSSICFKLLLFWIKYSLHQRFICMSGSLNYPSHNLSINLNQSNKRNLIVKEKLNLMYIALKQYYFQQFFFFWQI